MIPAGLLVHTVTIVTPAAPAVNAYGDVAADYGVGATRRTIAARIQQDTRAEDDSAQRDSTRQTWTLFANDTAITHVDRVEWTSPTGAVVFEISGPPEPTYAGSAAFHHLEVTMMMRAG